MMGEGKEEKRNETYWLSARTAIVNKPGRVYENYDLGGYSASKSYRIHGFSKKVKKKKEKRLAEMLSKKLFEGENKKTSQKENGFLQPPSKK